MNVERPMENIRLAGARMLMWLFWLNVPALMLIGWWLKAPDAEVGALAAALQLSGQSTSSGPKAACFIILTLPLTLNLPLNLPLPLTLTLTLPRRPASSSTARGRPSCRCARTPPHAAPRGWHAPAHIYIHVLLTALLGPGAS